MTAETLPPSAWAELQLADHHREELKASGISPAVAIERGYRTVTTQAELLRLNYKRGQANPPGLLVPLYNVAGELDGYQFKADTPRIQNGRPLKYESPKGHTATFDVPRRARQWIHTDHALYITEGSKKADAAVSRDLLCVSIPGVWNWKPASVIADMDAIPWKGRTVYLAFDSDWHTKTDVKRALYRLAAFLERKGAIVYAIDFPQGADGRKVGLDDWFMSGGDAVRLPHLARELELDEETKAAVHAAEARPVSGVFPDVPGLELLALIPAGYILSKKGVSVDTGETTKTLIPTPVLPTARLVNRRTGEESVRLAFWDVNHWREVSQPREVIASKSKIVSLAGGGVPVTSVNADGAIRWLADYMAANAHTLPVIATSDTLGWQGPGQFLLPDQFLARDEGGAAVRYLAADSGQAHRAGAFTQAGTLEGWQAAIGPAVGYERVRFAIAASFAAPLLEVIGCPSFVVDICGPTSGGKTSSLRLAGSVWGQSDPRVSPSLTATFQSTRVYKERIAAQSDGLPVIIDETQQAAKPGEIQSFLYDLTSGQGRGRGSLKGVQATASWRTVALISGESPAANVTEAAGLRGRTLTVWGRPFGHGPDAADIIRQMLEGISLHHGQAGPRWVAWILEHADQWDAWRAAWASDTAKLARWGGGGGLLSRVASYVRAVQFAEILACEAGILPWQPAEFSGVFLAELAGEARAGNVPADALLSVISWAAVRKEQFFDLRNPDQIAPRTNGWLGRWDREKDGTWEELALTGEQLRTALEANGFRDVQGITRQWADAGWLATDLGRLTKQIRFDGTKAWCYVIRSEAEGAARSLLIGPTGPTDTVGTPS